jgi:hypothetical protein
MAIGDLTKLGGNLESPRQCKPSDFPAVGPSGPEGSSSGAGQLVKMSEEQESPRSTQDGGDQTPSNWSKDTWKVSKSTGGQGTSVSFKGNVDLKDGKHCC